MKARVKATGEIINVEPCGEWTTMHGEILTYQGDNGVKYSRHELSFKIDDEGKSDYWTCLEHQYAGMAMQGILSNANHALWEMENNAEALAKSAAIIAHTLVEKLKEESK